MAFSVRCPWRLTFYLRFSLNLVNFASSPSPVRPVARLPPAPSLVVSSPRPYAILADAPLSAAGEAAQPVAPLRPNYTTFVCTTFYFLVLLNIEENFSIIYKMDKQHNRLYENCPYKYISFDEFIDEIRECHDFKYPRTANYYVLYNRILFNALNTNHMDYAKTLINNLLNEINNIQDTTRSPIDTKQILHHDSDKHIQLRQSLNSWAFIETSARVAVIRALAKTLNTCPYDDWRFVRDYVDNLVMCLREHEMVIRNKIEENFFLNK
jgi:hypothetical protein